MRSKYLVRSFATLCGLLLTIFVVSCKPSIPSEYIQPSEMEDMLYDYHLSMAIANRDGYTDIKQKAFTYDILRSYTISMLNLPSDWRMRHVHKVLQRVS